MKKALLFLLIFALLPVFPAAAEEEVTLITDRAGLEAVAEAPAGSYRLEADIDLGEGDWTPFAFSGVLDGNGHTVENLRITEAGEETRETLDGNFKKYETRFAGLFSAAEGAVIKNLTLKNAIVETECSQSCFVAGLAGYAADCEITDCVLSGRFTLYVNDGVNIGAGGLVGYMDSCTVERCAVDAELIVADRNTETVSEEFAGGLYASGRGRLRDCTVKTRIWASVHGYVHNGGCIGMAFWVHKKDSYKQYLYTTVSDTEITFFEHSPSKRGYSDPFIGENLGSNCRLSQNKKTYFVSNKVHSFDTLLLPEKPYEMR